MQIKYLDKEITMGALIIAVGSVVTATGVLIKAIENF
jgi:hypothetical protein